MRRLTILLLLFLSTSAHGLMMLKKLDTLTERCDLIAVIQIASVSDLVTSVPLDAVHHDFEKGGATVNGPYNGFFRTGSAHVRVALKGCKTNEVIRVDFDNLQSAEWNRYPDNVLFATNDYCLVFMKQWPNGHYSVIDPIDGKFPVNDDKLMRWRGVQEPVSLAIVLARIKQALDLNAKGRRPKESDAFDTQPSQNKASDAIGAKTAPQHQR